MKLASAALTSLALLAISCHRANGVRTAGSATHAVQGCSYVVDEVSAEPTLLEISVRCVGRGITGFSRVEPTGARFVRVLDSNATLVPNDGGWQFTAPQGEARIRYRVDLEGVASAERRFDTALRIGRSLVAPASTFLVQPEPLDVGVPLDVRVNMAPGEDFASGLLPLDATQRHFTLQAHEVSVGTYSIFGHFARTRVQVLGSELQVVTADAPLDLAWTVSQRWVAASAAAVGRFYGRFPAPHALILLLPVPERSTVVFGKVLPQSAPGVALLLGAHTPEPTLYQDWILVHELFHIGFPSFHDEAKWLDEGSATYFEPIIRARAGQLTEQQVWHDFARDMPQGLRAIEQEGLEHPSNFRAVYWGGAIACLLADVAARQHSRGAAGLEDGFRAVLAAGGNATQVWSLEQVTQVIDRALGAPILRQIVTEHANAAQPVGLPALLLRLGVVQASDGSVTLDDRAELAAIRHAITFGGR